MSEENSNLPKKNAAVDSNLQKIEEKKTAINTIDIWLKEHSKDEQLLQNFPEIDKLNVFRKELAGIAEKQKGYGKWSSRITKSISKKKSEISALIKKISQTKIEITEDETALAALSKGQSLEQLHDMRAEQQQRVNDFKELLSLAGVNDKLGNKGFFSQLFAPKPADKEVEELKEEANQLQLEIGKEHNLVIILESAITNEQLLKKMEADRQHLVDGKPCFLCGSLDHLYTKHPPAVSNSKQVLTEQKKKMKGLLSNAKDLDKQIHFAEAQAESESNKDNKLKLVRAQWRSLANKLNTATVDMSDLSFMKDLLKAEKQEFSNITSLLKKYTSKEHGITQSKLTLEVSETSLKRLNEEAESQQSEWDNRPKESIEIEQILKHHQAEEQAFSEIVAKQITELGEKWPAKREEQTALFDNLHKRRQEYQKYSENKKALYEETRT